MGNYLDKDVRDILLKVQEIEKDLFGLKKQDFQSGIICQKCGSSKNSVLNTRNNSGFIMRNRKCKDCGFSWNTEEIITRHGLYKKFMEGEQ